MKDKIIVAGYGGQGVLRLGQMIAYAALDDGWEVEWIPSYGAEMRGGTANCSLVISEEEISFAMVTNPNTLIVMNNDSLLRFGESIEPGATVILNSSLVTEKCTQSDAVIYSIPANEIAEAKKNSRGANMVMLGAFVALNDKIKLPEVYKIIDKSFTGDKKKFAELNKELVKCGYDHIISGKESELKNA